MKHELRQHHRRLLVVGVVLQQHHTLLLARVHVAGGEVQLREGEQGAAVGLTQAQGLVVQLHRLSGTSGRGGGTKVGGGMEASHSGGQGARQCGSAASTMLFAPFLLSHLVRLPELIVVLCQVETDAGGAIALCSQGLGHLPTQLGEELLLCVCGGGRQGRRED